MKGTGNFGIIVAIGAGQLVGHRGLPRKIGNGRTADNDARKETIGLVITGCGGRRICHFLPIAILKQILAVGESDYAKLAGIVQSRELGGGSIDLVEHKPHRPRSIKVFYIIGTGSQEEAKKKVCYVFERQSHWSIVYGVPTGKGGPKNGKDILKTGKGGPKNGKSVLSNLAQRDVCHRTRPVDGRQEADYPTESSGITNQNI